MKEESQKIKAISFIIGYWVFGLIYPFIFAPGSPELGFTIDFILSPFTSLLGYLFLGFGIIAIFVAGIFLVISEEILKRYPYNGFSIIIYGFIIPGVFWFTILRFMIWLS